MYNAWRQAVESCIEDDADKINNTSGKHYFRREDQREEDNHYSSEDSSSSEDEEGVGKARTKKRKSTL